MKLKYCIKCRSNYTLTTHYYNTYDELITAARRALRDSKWNLSHEEQKELKHGTDITVYDKGKYNVRVSKTDFGILRRREIRPRCTTD